VLARPEPARQKINAVMVAGVGAANQVTDISGASLATWGG
jgi:hypothetical protein